MRRYFALILLVANVSYGDSISDKAAEAPTPSRILDAWAKRADSFKSGKISWTVPIEGWNIFGRFETDWVPDSTTVGQEITGTLSFTAQSARYDSFSFSYADYGYSPTRHIYRDNLFLRFNIRANMYRVLLPYTVIFSPDEQLHFWHGNEKEYSRAIIMPAASEANSPSLASLTQLNGDSHTAFSGGPSSVLHQLMVAPALLTFRPLLYDRSLVQEGIQLEVDDFQPTYEGRPCAVLRVRHATEDVPANKTAIPPQKNSKYSKEQIYWVDPRRNYLVLRFIDLTNDYNFTQIDIHYNQVADIGWVPNTWTVLRYDPNSHFLKKIVTAMRTDIDTKHSISDARMKLSFPPQTIVIDTLKDKRYIVRDDLTKFELKEFRKNPIGLGKARLILIGLFNWPGLLIPITLILIMLVIINGRLVRRRNRRSAFAKPQVDSSLFPEVLDRHQE